MKTTPKDFFLWAGAIIALYSSITAIIALIFDYINYAYPDPLQTYFSTSSISTEMSIAVVAFPLFLVLMRLIRSDIRAHEEKAQLWVRRWAIVFTLFIAGAAGAIDIVTLINSFLSGDLTIQFLLKITTVLLVAGGTFLHFLADLKGYWDKEQQKVNTIGYAALVLVVATILSGFLIIGTPSQVRGYRFDSQRISDLQNIQWQIISYYQTKGMLPQDLSALHDSISQQSIPTDPDTKLAYSYSLTAPLSFKLCATFTADTQAYDESADNNYAYPAVAPLPVNASTSTIPALESQSWYHGKGETCFVRVIDPQRYPVQKNTGPGPAKRM